MPAEPQPDEDPAGIAEGLRELGDVWRIGIDTAQVMAERVLGLYRDLPATARVATGDLDAELRRIRIDLERAVDLSMDVFDRVLTVVTRLEPSARRDEHEKPREEVELEAPAGGRASTELWVHNVSETSQAAPDLRCRVLTSFQGDRIPESCVLVECSELPIEAQSSRAVVVAVDVPVGTPAGVYHGLILSGDDPEAAMPVRVRVTG